MKRERPLMKKLLFTIILAASLISGAAFAGSIDPPWIEPEITPPTVSQPQKYICGDWYQRIGWFLWENMETQEEIGYFAMMRLKRNCDDTPPPPVCDDCPPPPPPPVCEGNDCTPPPPVCDDCEPPNPERVKGNNGFGNNDQPAPGKSGGRNKAENEGPSDDDHGHGPASSDKDKGKSGDAPGQQDHE